MDLIVRCPRVPARGETIRGEEFRTAGGGKGANQAVACGRLDAQTRMVGRVGEDEFGRTLRADLAASGVDTDFVRVDPQAASGVALILLEQSGDNRIVIISGANGRMGDEDVAAAAALLDWADVLLMQLELPLTVVKALALEARARSVLSVLDAGPVTPAVIQAGFPALVDVISPNENEAEALTGIRVGGMNETRAAAHHLREAGGRDVVLKLGERGAYWSGQDGEAHFPAFPIQPVDTTAAGDAFTACLAVCLAGGLPMPGAIRRANAAGALACLKVGAQPSMPTSEELDAFLRAHGA